jgi:hypothetical protein
LKFGRLQVAPTARPPDPSVAKSGPVWQCPNRECKHKQDVPQPEAVLS